MNVAMWWKALRIIPQISKQEWDDLDLVSRWLIATRAAVLVMTFLSAAIAGILALDAGRFNLLRWVLLAVGLCMAHATNNLLNDYVDYVRGVDEDNYYRAQYGPQPLVHGLLTKAQLLRYAAVTGSVAAACGAVLIALRGGWTALLMGVGALFVLFYTWPLKTVALGELSVLVVWGPLMIGGGYYVVAGRWDGGVIVAGLVYALGVTGVILGKHIDKREADEEKGIHTLPVLIGERASRYLTTAMLVLQYVAVAYLVLIRTFHPVVLVTFLALPSLVRIWPILRRPRPAEKPADFPDVWPNYYVAAAFYHNRNLGMLYLVGLVSQAIVRLVTR